MRNDLDHPVQIGNEWVFPTGERLPVISGGFDGEEGTPGDPAPEAEATDATADAPAAEGEAGATEGEASEAEAVDAYAIPEDLLALTGDEFATGAQAEIDRLEAEIVTAREAGVTTMAEVEHLRSLRAGQAAIAAESQRRIDEAAAVAAGLGELGDAPTLPAPEPVVADTPQARAAAVRQAAARTTPRGGTPAQAGAVTPPAADAQPETRTAAVLETARRWRNVREDFGAVGAPANFADLINRTNIGTGQQVSQRRDSIMASIAVEPDGLGYVLGDSTSENEAQIAACLEDHRRRRKELAADSDLPIRQAAICDPPSINRNASTCGVDDTPLQSLLPFMTATSGNRLKFQFRTPTTFAEVADGVGEWSTTLQDAIDVADPDTWKPCVPIACPTYTTEQASEITSCYTIDAYTELSSPEAEADFVAKLDVAEARFTEGWFLRKLDTFLHPFSFNGYMGAIPDTIEAALTVTTYGDFVERLEEGSYVIIASPGLDKALTIDANKQAFNTDARTRADVVALLRGATGNDYVQLKDLPLTGALGVGAFPSNPFPTLPTVGGSATALTNGTGGIGTGGNMLNAQVFTLRIIDPSSFLGWTTGEGVFGEQITLDQARQNKRGLFKRRFGGLMKPGCAPGFKITVGLCPDGSRGGFVAPGCPPTGFTDAGVDFDAAPQD
jgi:hypothetical protein